MMWASAEIHERYMQPVKTLRKCWCGCEQRATHTGFANGIAMTAPACELMARRWVKQGSQAASRRVHQQLGGEGK